MIREAIVALVCFSPSAASAELPLEWLACKEKSDCVVAKGVCGDLAAVNRDHKMKFEENARTSEMVMDCLSFSGAEAVREAKQNLACKESKCVLLKVLEKEQTK